MPSAHSYSSHPTAHYIQTTYSSQTRALAAYTRSHHLIYLYCHMVTSRAVHPLTSPYTPLLPHGHITCCTPAHITLYTSTATWSHHVLYTRSHHLIYTSTATWSHHVLYTRSHHLIYLYCHMVTSRAVHPLTSPYIPLLPHGHITCCTPAHITLYTSTSTWSHHVLYTRSHTEGA